MPLNNSEYYIDASIYDESALIKKKTLCINILLWLTIAIAIVFFISWCVAINFVQYTLAKDTRYGRLLYFANPNLWKTYVFATDYHNFTAASLHNQLIVFLISFYISIYSLIFLNIFALSLIGLSLNTDKKEYRFIGVVSLIPVLNILLYILFLLHKAAYYLNEEIPKYNNNYRCNDFLFKLHVFTNNYIARVNALDVWLNNEDKYKNLKIDRKPTKPEAWKNFIKKI